MTPVSPKPRVMVVYGTRPEAIKLAPVVRALRASPHLDVTVAVTGQHRAMLDQVNALFGIVPDRDLDVIQPRQELHQITERVLGGMTEVIRDVAPAAVVVQGDTTTSFAAALAAFYEKVPVVHVEAGLRTQNRYDPFPEEINRRLTSQLTSLHLAPTPTSRANLLAEGISAVRRGRHGQHRDRRAPRRRVETATPGEQGPRGDGARRRGPRHHPPPRVVGRADGPDGQRRRTAGQGVRGRTVRRARRTSTRSCARSCCHRSKDCRTSSSLSRCPTATSRGRCSPAS